jgi:hypothetical protein
MKFPRPWTIARTGPEDSVVLDANGRKLFYMIGDDEEHGESVLFYSDDHMSLLEELERLFGSKVQS